MIVRVMFTSLSEVLEALLIVLNDARSTQYDYSFGSTSAQQVLASGLILRGEIDDVLSKLDDAGLGQHFLD